jgi:curli biogenesis system outer membrane secretion channel CsgG
MKLKSIERKKAVFTLALMVLLLVLLGACAGQKTAPEEKAEAQSKPAASKEAPVEKEPLLSKPFRMIVVEDFQAAAEVTKNYPDAVREVQARLMWTLEDKKQYQSVANAEAGRKYPAGTLLIKANITDMRIVHGAARFWGGAFAGRSYINLDLQLIDAATSEMLRQKSLSSANNAWAASWVGGSSDQSMPANMGRMVAEYIHSNIPR